MVKNNKEKEKEELTIELDSSYEFYNLNFKNIKQFDNLLRCSICKEIFKVPNSIKECGHTFCSKCIRESLVSMSLNNNLGIKIKCPICYIKIDQSKLIFNKFLDEISNNWLESRKELLLLQSKWESLTNSQIASTSNLPSTSTLTSNSNSNSSLDAPSGSTRSSRSKTTAATTTVEPIVAKSNGASSKVKGKGKGKEIEVIDDSDDSDIEVMDMNDPDLEVTCPMPNCYKKFKNQNLNFHIDRDHDLNGNLKASTQWSNILGMGGSTQSGVGGGGGGGGGGSKKTRGSTWSLSKNGNSFSSSAVDVKPSIKPEDKPLSTETYSIMKVVDLSNLLKSLGLPTTIPEGSAKKSTLERRHRQWTAIWNANCDLLSSDPRKKSKTKLKEELIKWEFLQDSKPVEIGNTSKYERENKSAFKELTAQARISMEKMKALRSTIPITTTGTSTDSIPEVEEPEAPEENQEEDITMKETIPLSPPRPPTTIEAEATISSSLSPPLPTTVSSPREPFIAPPPEVPTILESESDLTEISPSSPPAPPPPAVESVSSPSPSPTGNSIINVPSPTNGNGNGNGNGSSRKRTRSELEGTNELLLEPLVDLEDSDSDLEMNEEINGESRAEGGKSKRVKFVLPSPVSIVEVQHQPEIAVAEEQEEQEEEEEEEESNNSSTELELPRPSQRVKADEEIIDWSLFDRDDDYNSDSDDSDDEAGKMVI